MKLRYLASFFLAQGGVFAKCDPVALDTKNEVSYTGIRRNGIELFLGIKFGQDTGGASRFKPPQPFLPEKGSKVSAKEYGPACPQMLGPSLPPLAITNATAISEDCLNLIVGRPEGTKPEAKLPVTIWIHGGGLWIGKNDEESTAPDGLVANSVEHGTPIIQVSVNYRLGVFGFAQSAALRADKSENAGLRDQRLAIEWVRDNIAYFGGDPSRITIQGQSSGGLSVSMQMLAYGATKPIAFQQAIIQSQALAPFMAGNFTTDSMKRVADALACNTTSTDSPETIACFRRASMETLEQAALDTYLGDISHNVGDVCYVSGVLDPPIWEMCYAEEKPVSGDIWLPSIDGDFIPERPSALIESGKFHAVPTMIGWSEDDLAFYTDATIATAEDTDAFISAYLQKFPKELVVKLLALYPVEEFPARRGLTAEFIRASRIFRDVFMICQPNWFADHIHAAGKSVYLYQWNQTILAPILEQLYGTPSLGPVHSSENAYVFGSIAAWNQSGWVFEPTEKDYSLVRRATRSWASFVTGGEPSLQGKETFQGWTEAFDEGKERKLFVAGGPDEGLSAFSGPEAKPAIRAQRLDEICGLVNSPEFVKALTF